MCNACTKPRNDKDSRPYTSIDAHQKVGLVLNVGIAKVLDVHGIEVQVQSMSDPIFPTWIVTSRGHERLVNELHLHNTTIVNHSSLLLRREETSDQVNQDFNKPAFGKSMPGPKGSDSVGMREKPSNSLRETGASRVNSNLQSGNRCLLERFRACPSTFENRVQSSGKKHSGVQKERNLDDVQSLDCNSWTSTK